MKILCSGNPQHQTVANGVKQIYPEADFASRATGFDLRFCLKEVNYTLEMLLQTTQSLSTAVLSVDGDSINF